jgi:membrane protein YqaA with SNARE-associated domain
MFAPSFFTGTIITSLGNRNVMMIGLFLYAFSISFTLRLPSEVIIVPVKKEGANIAITCH